MVDIDRLHNLFLNEDKLTGRSEGHTTLFIWQLIGIAELNCYSWNKIHQPVWIPFNKPVSNVLNILHDIGKICYENGVDFAKNSSHQFVIYNTLFNFYQVSDVPFKDPITPQGKYWFSSRQDNDAIYRIWEMTNENYSRHIRETFDHVNVCGLDLIVG
jgi:hypothetical protein